VKEKLGVGCVLALVLALVLGAIGGAVALGLLMEPEVPGLEPSPFRGGSDLAVDLNGGTDGAREGEVLVRRLEALGLRADAPTATYGYIRLEIDDVDGIEVLEPLLAVGRFEVNLVAADQSALSEERLGTLPPQASRHRTDRGRLTVRAPNEAALSPVIAMLDPTSARSYCTAECEVVLLEPATLTTIDVADAVVAVDGRGHATVSVTLESGGASRYETLTTSHAGEEIAFVLDGKVLAVAPIVAPVSDGRFTFAVTSEERAHMVAAILAGKDELYGTWTVGSVNVGQ
jgi:preprotein translocase subunit SecD